MERKGAVIITHYGTLFGKLINIGGDNPIMAVFESVLENAIYSVENLSEEQAKEMAKNLFDVFAIEGEFKKEITMPKNINETAFINVKLTNFYVISDDGISEKVERLHELAKEHYKGVTNFVEHFRKIREEE